MFESLTQRLTQSFSFLRGRKELTEENLDEGLRQVRTALLEADVHFQVTRDFVARVKERLVGGKRLEGVDPADQFVHAFHRELVDLLGPEEARLEFAKRGPTVILMAGLQGAGKTTTCAKLAKQLKEKHGRRPPLVAADGKRPAAVQQPKVLGSRIGVPVFHEEGLTPPKMCERGLAHAMAKNYDVVILDTAGRLHVDDELMAEGARIAKGTKPHDQVLVVAAMTGQDAGPSAKAFHERLALTGVILTKIDGDARGGAAVSLKAITGCPILFVGTGEKIDDLDAFHPERMAGRILGMGDVVGLVERAQETIDEKEAQKGFEKLVMGSFTLEDMRSQMRMIRKLGPMKKVLGMMPGMSGMSGLVDQVDEKQLDRLDALFSSMTPRERQQPEIIEVSRRRRIARGSGQPIDAVNDLLKRFKEMKRMMKSLGKMGLGAKFGKKAKLEALQGMSADGQLADPSAGRGGGLLGGLFGGGGGGEALPGGAGGLGGMPGFGGGPGDLGGLMGGARPMGSSATRKSGKSNRDKQKAAEKAKRKNRRRK